MRLAILWALVLAPSALSAVPLAADTTYIEVVLAVDGRLLDRSFVDVDLDGRLDVMLAVRTTAGRRELHLHRGREDGSVPVTPDSIIPVLDDVVAWGLANVRDEPGREVLFLTRGGAWSLSPTLPGLRGNIRRLAALDLLFDLPSRDQLPRWSFVIEAPGRDLVVLPGRSTFSLWGPHMGEVPAGDADYRAVSVFGKVDGSVSFHGTSPDDMEIESDGGRILFQDVTHDVFLDETVSYFSALLSTDDDYRSPALADVDGDGAADLLLRRKGTVELHGHRQLLETARSTPAMTDGTMTDGSLAPRAHPARVETLPAYLRGDHDFTLQLVDLDGNGTRDLLARRAEEKQDDLEPFVTDILVLLNDGKRLLPEKPHQVLRFEANRVDVSVTDVNSDGRPDLVVTKFEMPSVADFITGGKLSRSTYVYLGDTQRPFTRKPVLRDEQSFDIENLADAIVSRRLSHDLDGDGLEDLVETDLLGHVVVRRLVHESSFFGGDNWEFEPLPWKMFEMPGAIGRLGVTDINGDGLGDLVVPRHDRLLLQLSRRGTNR